MPNNPKIDAYPVKAKNWQGEVTALRNLLLTTELTEDFKWGNPCYTLNNSNVVLIHTFKDYCALLFFKGALMPDPHNLLIQQTENVQSARQIRFASITDIQHKADQLQDYFQGAIAVEKAGLKVERKNTEEFKIAEEFQAQLTANAALKTAFAALTPGRQRAYLLHFAAPKQAATRQSRVAKCIPQILAGKGLNDD